MPQDLVFYCGGCNRTTQSLSWSSCNQYIAYGSCNSVVVYIATRDDACYKIIAVLNQHKARVNCLQWIDSSCQMLVSGSSDGSIITWADANKKWECKQILKEHTSSVVSLASLSYTEGERDVILMASGSSDSTVRLWKSELNCEDFSCLQTISFGNGFAFTVALSTLPGTNGLILACGCDDTTVKLYTWNNKEFTNVMTLKGHEDWVRCLAFKTINKSLVLASSSQDMFIRLWKISTQNEPSGERSDSDIVALEEQLFTSYSEKYMVVLESVLIGHEGWVLGLSWDPTKNASRLLSASMDRTMIVWEYSNEDEIWLDKARMGEVGGNTLGYYGCAFGGDGDILLGHGYHGSFNMWKRKEKETEKWEAIPTISGHFGGVEDFDWDPRGEFVITTSTDQTTRLFAPWKRSGMKTTWHEIARPQVHGYDMKCIVMLNRYKFASGGQEKVVRIFGAPKAFYDSFTCITNTSRDNEDKPAENGKEDLPLGATVPVLGLSNKAVYQADIESWDEKREKQSQPMKASAFANEDPAPFNPTLIREPPVEDTLLQNTLWPELQKLYGHGFELFCLAASPDGSVLVTACKASKVEHANILVWNASTWTQTDDLQAAHSLTITQMCFSPDGRFLLSVSRDRTWAVHQRRSLGEEKEVDSPDAKYKFTLVQKTDKKTSVHTRIIWACDWFPNNDNFVTASRDKKCIVWERKKSEQTQCWCPVGECLDVCEPATAVSCHDKKNADGRYIVAVGTESGRIFIYTWLNEWRLAYDIDRSLTPCLTVKRLRWRCKRTDTENTNSGNTDSTNEESLQLGVCSNDHSFRILQFLLF